MDRGTALWYVQLFGGLHAVRQPGEGITRFRSHKSGALLAYLSLFPRRSHTREALADLLWPEADTATGRINLRTVLSALRREMEPDSIPAGSVLVTVGHRDVGLAPAAVETDVERFERAVRAAGRPPATPDEKALLLAEAVALYDGPLLPGFYEDWAVAERNRLAALYGDALGQLSRLRERAGDPAGAEELSRRLLAADPLSEEAHVSLIRLRAAAGDRVGALRQYQELERLLEERLGVEPGPEVRTLAEALRDRRSLGAPPPPTSLAPPRTPVTTLPDANAFGTAGRAAADDAPRTRTSPTPAWPDPAGPTPCPVCLPATFTTFCGREDEVAALSSLLGSRQARLVTITGLGGSGKTRLAVETARRMVDDFAGGVLFVPLADVRDADRLPEAIADTLGLPRSAAVPLFDQVARALNRAAQPVLLVLDNFEQVAEEGAALVQALLAASPALRCLVTSRRRLLVESEREFALASLPIPEHPGTPERLLEFASVQLFVSRARAARSDFELNARNSDAVAELCTRLEGVPLALELAAAWAHMLTPAQMLERLGRRFDLLVARRRDAPPRHATLRSTMLWGLDLLSPESRDLFARLSVFRGGFTLEAVEEVCEEPDALTRLATLQDHSLLLAEEPGGGVDDGADASPAAASGMRYRMLETVREFAREQWDQSPDERRARLSVRHAAYFLRKAEAAEPHLRGSREQHFRIDHLQAERANLHAALEWTRAAAADSDAGGPGERAAAMATHLRLCGALWPFWYLRGHLGEAALWLLRDDFPVGERDSAGEVPPEVLARALHARAEVAHLREVLDRSTEAMERALDLYRRIGDRSGEGQGMARLARWRHDLPYAHRRAMARAARHLCRAAGDPRAEAEVLTDQAWLIRYQPRNYPRAQRFMARAVELYRAAGDEAHVIGALREMGTWHAWGGNTDRARPLLDEALAMARRQDNVREAGYLLWIRGYVAVLDDDLDDATEMLREGAQVARAIGD
ncbi:MAG TPA: BTAD domain-containing putative transcriptional regulator, partial [Armatimonadaceae bacterium]|nr:BTAD domain-containing putative transcriptional regulator [Armatimonadaceae bacterium]